MFLRRTLPGPYMQRILWKRGMSSGTRTSEYSWLFRFLVCTAFVPNSQLIWVFFFTNNQLSKYGRQHARDFSKIFGWIISCSFEMLVTCLNFSSFFLQFTPSFLNWCDTSVVTLLVNFLSSWMVNVEIIHKLLHELVCPVSYPIDQLSRSLSYASTMQNFMKRPLYHCLKWNHI